MPRIDDVLERVPEESNADSPFGRYRGYSLGKTTFKRKDGLPIQQEDLDLMNSERWGQRHDVIGKVGDLTARIEWECDSGD